MPVRQEIEHVVVLMMENRSFDHVLGYLGLPPYQRAVNGLQHAHPVPYQGREYRPEPLKSSIFSPDPDHGSARIAMQMKDGMRGFIESFATQPHHPPKSRPERVINYLTPRFVPTYHLLAEHYAICDAWFSSIAGSTWPNRLYALSGTAEGALDNPTVTPEQLPAYQTQTIFEHLSTREITWRIYKHNLAFVRVFRDFRMLPRHTIDFDDPIEGFAADCKGGSLAALTWIDPRFEDVAAGGNDDHPPSDVLKGQELVRQVYNALRANPALFAKTLLIITYDEHGGFYDHVDPTTLTPPADDHAGPGYGPRVPGFLISPWVEPGHVSSTTYDHTSILKTIFERFTPDDPPDMGKRVAAATSLWGAVTRTTPRPPGELPEAPQVLRSGFESQVDDTNAECDPEGPVRSHAHDILFAIAARKDEQSLG